MSSFKKNLAVLIGINGYSNGITPLHTAAADATAIAQVLKDKHSYQVEPYLDEAATLEKLSTLLQSLKVGDKDRLLFYFAGHGIALTGEDGPEGYLIPQDAKLGDVTTYLPMAQVEAALTKLPCRHCLIILDCCFGGAFRWSSTRKLVAISEVIHRERYDRFIQDPAWQVITSASHDQHALDALDLKNERGVDRFRTQHSPFAIALMDALTGKADAYPPGKNGIPPGDGVITATELYLYLRDTVEVVTNARNLRQTPGLWSLKKHDKGEYIFLTPGHKLNLPSAPTLNSTEENNPYRGLKAYEKENCALFFGRAPLIEKLCEFVCDRPLTVVLGASGSGKSSLVKAGLIPHLEGFEVQHQQRGRKLDQEKQPHVHKQQKWHILPIIRPGESPLTSLKEAFQEFFVFSTEASQTTQLGSGTLIEALKNWHSNHPDTRLMLVVDQSEELITQCLNEQEREQFFKLISILVEECSGYFHAVLTLRSDFEPQFSEHKALKSTWISSRFIVPAMTRDELREVIEEPASSKVVYFETSEQRGSLTEQLINEVAAMPGALPLLSFALSELYLKLAHRFLHTSTTGEIADRLITWQDYDELGGVTRSLTERADKECKSLTDQDQGYSQTIRSVLLRMVSIDGGSATKRKVPLSELKYPDGESDRVSQAVARFEQARLLTSSSIEDEGTPYVEPAHDALISGWQRLREWIQADGENLTIRRQLTHAAVDWQQSEQRSRFLWHNNPRLSLFEQGSQTNPLLNQLERHFVQSSVRKRRMNTVRNGGVGVGGVLLALGVMVFLRSSEINQVRDLQGSAAGRLLLGQNLEALVESIKAVKALKHPLLRLFAPPDTLQNEVQATLQNAMSQARERNRLVADGDIQNIAFSPDSQMIATAHTDNTVSFWDTSGQRLTGLNTLEVDTISGTIWDFSFTPDGEQLVIEGYDEARQGTIAKRWNIRGNLQIEEALDLESFGINAAERSTLTDSNEYVAISPDGTYYARVSDRTLYIYRYNPNNRNYQWVATGQGANFFNSNTEAFNVRFSPDSQRIVTASSVDENAYLWDLGGNQLAQFRHTGGIVDLAFNPDGQQLATVGRDGTVRVWQNLEGSQLQEFRGYSGQDEATSIRISSSGQQFAVATASGTVQVGNLASQESTVVLPPLDQAIAELRFSPDDRFLALGNSKDGKVWIWNLETLLLTPEMKGFGFSDLGTFQRDIYGGGLWSGSFSPDNQWLALGGNDTVLHNIMQPEQQISLPIEGVEGHVGSGWRQGLAFDETGQLLAAGGFDGQLELWDWQQQSKVDEIEARMTPQYVTFSPNGDLVAMSGIDNGTVVVRLWNREKQQQVELRGHTQAINSVVFSPDGNQLATASRDGTARVWNLQGQQLAVFKGHDEVKHVAFSADGRQLITAGFSRNIVNPELRSQFQSGQLWQVKTWEMQTLDELLIEGCTWIQGYLNHSQDLESEPEFRGDRTLCDDIISNSSVQITPAQIIDLTAVTPSGEETTLSEISSLP